MPFLGALYPATNRRADDPPSPRAATLRSSRRVERPFPATSEVNCEASNAVTLISSRAASRPRSLPSVFPLSHETKRMTTTFASTMSSTARGAGCAVPEGLAGRGSGSHCVGLPAIPRQSSNNHHNANMSSRQRMMGTMRPCAVMYPIAATGVMDWSQRTIDEQRLREATEVMDLEAVVAAGMRARRSSVSRDDEAEPRTSIEKKKKGEAADLQETDEATAAATAAAAKISKGKGFRGTVSCRPAAQDASFQREAVTFTSESTYGGENEEEKGVLASPMMVRRLSRKDISRSFEAQRQHQGTLTTLPPHAPQQSHHLWVFQSGLCLARQTAMYRLFVLYCDLHNAVQLVLGKAGLIWEVLLLREPVQGGQLHKAWQDAGRTYDPIVWLMARGAEGAMRTAAADGREGSTQHVGTRNSGGGFNAPSAHLVRTNANAKAGDGGSAGGKGIPAPLSPSRGENAKTARAGTTASVSTAFALQLLSDIANQSKPAVPTLLDVALAVVFAPPIRPINSKQLRRVFYTLSLRLCDRVMVLHKALLGLHATIARKQDTTSREWLQHTLTFSAVPTAEELAFYMRESGVPNGVYRSIDISGMTSTITPNGDEIYHAQQDRNRALQPSIEDVKVWETLVQTLHVTGVPTLKPEHLLDTLASVMAAAAAPVELPPSTTYVTYGNYYKKQHHNSNEEGGHPIVSNGGSSRGGGDRSYRASGGTAASGFQAESLARGATWAEEVSTIRIKAKRAAEEAELQQCHQQGGAGAGGAVEALGSAAAIAESHQHQQQQDSKSLSSLLPEWDLSLALFSLDVIGHDALHAQRDFALSLHEVEVLLRCAVFLCQARLEEDGTYITHTVKSLPMGASPHNESIAGDGSSSNDDIRAHVSLLWQQAFGVLDYLWGSRMYTVGSHFAKKCVQDLAPVLYAAIREQHMVYCTGRKDRHIAGMMASTFFKDCISLVSSPKKSQQSSQQLQQRHDSLGAAAVNSKDGAETQQQQQRRRSTAMHTATTTAMNTTEILRSNYICSDIQVRFPRSFFVMAVCHESAAQLQENQILSLWLMTSPEQQALLRSCGGGRGEGVPRGVRAMTNKEATAATTGGDENSSSVRRGVFEGTPQARNHGNVCSIVSNATGKGRHNAHRNSSVRRARASEGEAVLKVVAQVRAAYVESSTVSPGYHLNEKVSPLLLPVRPPAVELMAWLKKRSTTGRMGSVIATNVRRMIHSASVTKMDDLSHAILGEGGDVHIGERSRPQATPRDRGFTTTSGRLTYRKSGTALSPFAVMLRRHGLSAAQETATSATMRDGTPAVYATGTQHSLHANHHSSLANGEYEDSLVARRRKAELADTQCGRVVDTFMVDDYERQLLAAPESISDCPPLTLGVLS